MLLLIRITVVPRFVAEIREGVMSLSLCSRLKRQSKEVSLSLYDRRWNSGRWSDLLIGSLSDRRKTKPGLLSFGSVRSLCQTLTLRQGALLGQGPAKVCSGLSTTLLPKQSGDYGVRLQRALLQELEPVNMAVCGLILYEMRVLFMCVMQLHSRDLILIACVTSWEVRSL